MEVEMLTPRQVVVNLDMPTDLATFKLPNALDDRLQHLLDRQDRGERLTPAERQEAEALVNLAELLSLLQLRARRLWREGQC